ncbi:MAG TPA: sigma 54-interacting transcriptional regulator [Anaerovoracaceae bacterium]|nr:sigma 54-interacting transcriptional regulator [Anaerovoracaceae bacterium]
MKNLPLKCIGLILEQIGVIAITDKVGRYTFVNKKWQDDTEITAEEAIGRYAHELIERSKVDVAIKTKKPVIADIMISTKSGKVLPAIISYIPIFNEDEIAGCFIYSNFLTMDQAHIFSEKIESITKEFEFLKDKLRERSGAKYKIDDLIGEGPAMSRLKEQVYLAGASNSTVLIEGETGTGKELVAHAIHNCSLRDIFPFVKVNCSAIPENLMESEFFGYEEGTFTGARKGGQRGKFENAHLGSIFLDEINNMDLKMQPKLLRVLQEKEIERLGGHESIKIDVRVIAATNVPLHSLVNSNKFRKDLYYRLNIVHIVLPPLRERKEDIPLLARSIINKVNDEVGTNIVDISEEALDKLMRYHWPGNVRELANVIERAINASIGSKLTLADFVFSNAVGSFENSISKIHSKPDLVGLKIGKMRIDSEKKQRSEKETILAALEACNHNKAKTARLLNYSRTTLYKKLRKYDID